jgi:L-alanine-DL-glutamate epimerase-like enolase superfamily enzyme
VVAALHICAAAPNVMIQETVRGFYEGYYLDILSRSLPIHDGQATFDLGPGLGAQLRPELLARPDLRRRISNGSIERR